MSQAVRDYLKLQEWQRHKIEAGVAVADAGNFVKHREFTRIAGKHSTRR